MIRLPGAPAPFDTRTRYDGTGDPNPRSLGENWWQDAAPTTAAIAATPFMLPAGTAASGTTAASAAAYPSTAAQWAPTAVALGSGYLNSQGQREANQNSKEHAQKEREQQELFAKHGLGWKIQDAIAHGISPLAALGATGAQYSPTQITYGNEKSGIADAGQNLSDNMFRSYLQNQQMRGSDLDNQLKAAQIGKLQAETNSLINPTVLRDNNQPYATKESQPQIDWVDLPGNSVQAQMSVEAASRLQDDMPARLSFFTERALNRYKPPTDRLPYPFTQWESEGFTGRWKAIKPDHDLYRKINPNKPYNKNYKAKEYGPVIPYKGMP